MALPDNVEMWKYASRIFFPGWEIIMQKKSDSIHSGKSGQERKSGQACNQICSGCNSLWVPLLANRILT